MTTTTSDPRIRTRPSPVYDELLVQLDETPRTMGECARRVSRSLGREICVATISRALKKARDRGAAIQTKHGWREPDDQLAPSNLLRTHA